MSDQESSAGERILRRPAARTDIPDRRAQTGSESGLRKTLVRILEVIAIVAGLLATAVISAAITFTLAVRSNEVSVPDLGGTNADTARDMLARQELRLVLEGNRFHESVPKDFIAFQSPETGTTLKKGRAVRVWVSLGPERHTVPRIEGESLQSAQLILEQGGFTLGRVVEIHSDVYAPDTVVAQSPQAYEEVANTSEVSLLISRGYVDEAFVMPDLIGRDYVDLLDELGRGSLKVSQVKLVDYPGVRKNVVVRQTPLPGTKVFKRDRIILYLSNGN
ncbi:MAG TPA: PASTA domain-containing protein [Vicinamibacteria bacterium]|nr:PASTA domain-containing protein [Vicinamibacteria bacterium]